jgi:hypothetical protein
MDTTAKMTSKVHQNWVLGAVSKTDAMPSIVKEMWHF